MFCRDVSSLMKAIYTASLSKPPPSSVAVSGGGRAQVIKKGPRPSGRWACQQTLCLRRHRSSYAAYIHRTARCHRLIRILFHLQLSSHGQAGKVPVAANPSARGGHGTVVPKRKNEAVLLPRKFTCDRASEHNRTNIPIRELYGVGALCVLPQHYRSIAHSTYLILFVRRSAPIPNTRLVNMSPLA